MNSGTCNRNAWSSRPVRPTLATQAYRLKRSNVSRAKCPYSGVCLGHQAIGEAFGGIVDHAGELKHGKTSMIEHTDEGIFAGLPNPFEAVRYHSLAVQPNAVPPGFKITARSAESGVIMGMRHPEMPIEGVQFHPESILTRPGKDLLQNFLEMGV